MRIDTKSSAWVAVGSAEHWQLAFDQGGIWGLVEGHHSRWSQLKRGDLVFLYAKAPVSGLVGYGRITKTFRQDKPLWPPEIQSGKVIWPLRFEFELLSFVPTPSWKLERVKVEEIPVQRLQSGFLQITSEVAAKLAQKFPKILGLVARESPPPAYLQTPGHDDVQSLLVEIGSFQRFIADREYPMERERLDVVWRKVVRSVPTYVFEVQIGGDVYHALGKLKSSHEIWNSRIFLVGKENELEVKARSLLSGAFHEIQPVLRFLDIERVTRLHALKHELRNMEEALHLT